MDTPSGLFPSDRLIPEGSRCEGTLAADRALWMRWHDDDDGHLWPCVPNWSTSVPQWQQLWGLHRGESNLKPTAIHKVSSWGQRMSRKPSTWRSQKVSFGPSISGTLRGSIRMGGWRRLVMTVGPMGFCFSWMGWCETKLWNLMNKIWGGTHRGGRAATRNFVT